MKKNRIILGLAVTAMLSLGSCAKSGCTDNSAENFSSKAKTDDGTCTYGVAGFVGTWNAVDSSEFSTTVKKVARRTVTITAASGSNTRIIISRIKDDLNLAATVGSSQVTLDNRSSGAFDFVMSGSGKIANKVVTINYKTNISGDGVLTLTK
jgi:hypothetical protein